jgi:iron complex outermembrane recepter protein
MRHRFFAAALTGVAITGWTADNLAEAQTPTKYPATGQTPAAATNTDSVEEIVVTARKVDERLGDIPATISAVSAAQLAATGPVVSTGDLLRTVPGVRFNNLQSPNLSEISIRGSGTERATGADSGIGLFVNGAYVGSSTLGGRNFKNIDYFDLERVEVLEGPQGALYGRNSEYGVVNIVSAKPKFDDTSGSVDESFIGKLDQNQLIGTQNYALDDNWAVRVGAEAISQSKGFYRNPDDDKYYDHTSGWLARAQVRYRNGPLDVNLSVDGQDLKLPTFVVSYAVTPGTLATIPLGYTQSRFNVPIDGVNDTEQRVQRAQLVANLDLDWATLTSTSTASHFSSQQYYGSSIDLNTEAQLQEQGEIGAYPLSQVHTDVRDSTAYEDLHLAGKAFDNNLDWLGGAEVLDQHDHYILSVATSPCTLTAKSSICGGTPTDPLCYSLLPTSTPCPITFPAIFGTASATPLHYTSEAAYGSLRYKLDDFTLSGEGRYTQDRKIATQSATALYTDTPTTRPNSYRFSAGKASYTATLSYKLPSSWDDMLYSKVGTGYRSGGVNSGTSTPVAPIPFRPTYGDEETISYEAGFKGNLGSHVFITLDGYFSRTDNAITSITDGCTVLNVCKQGATIFNINAGTVHAHGVELAIDSRFRVAGGDLDLNLNGADQRADYVSVNGTYNGLPVVGSSVAQIPNWTASATVNYLHSITSDLDAFLHVTYNGESGGGQDTVTVAAPFVPLASITDVSLRTGIDYHNLQVAVFVQNLTDQTVRLLTLQTGGVTYGYRYNEPRTVGVNAIYHW